jgi:hypothetical protein
VKRGCMTICRVRGRCGSSPNEATANAGPIGWDPNAVCLRRRCDRAGPRLAGPDQPAGLAWLITASAGWRKSWGLPFSGWTHGPPRRQIVQRGRPTHSISTVKGDGPTMHERRTDSLIYATLVLAATVAVLSLEHPGGLVRQAALLMLTASASELAVAAGAVGDLDAPP